MNDFAALMENVPWVQLLLPYLLNRDKSIRTTHLFTISVFVRPLIIMLSQPKSDLCLQVSYHARAARASDICTLKKDLHLYLPHQTMTTGEELPPPPVVHCIKERNFGFKGTYTGRLQTPIEDVAKFDQDPKA